ncbi:hypothetical protein K9N68_03850 [Kovacikia minuta CCNUW1]|uniref:hypothetical protein n=1 Tax=Kovacikia minuta TaxID=2931930 RepID=UPI001CCD969D|nr:hypothetical protein [Kovacikia minuta]UBF27113.1 hypothetical protein K9N68_03850 [Kovacikia minuta CCNUW1]
MYHLIAGDIKQAWHFYGDALKREALTSTIQVAIRDLVDFLRVFPEDQWAKRAKAELEKRTRKQGQCYQHNQSLNSGRRLLDAQKPKIPDK